MTIWIIEPRDPLIVRDGRPFGPNPGARARSLDFPFPSTIAGGFRSQAGKDSDGFFDVSKRSDVKQIGIRGPLLVELGDDKLKWLAPAPADALLLKKNDESPVVRHRLRPLDNTGTLSDLPMPLKHPVGMVEPDLNKPCKNAPHYWYWQQFEQWLVNPPNASEELDKQQMQALGHNGPGQEWRMHVKIEPETLTGEEGMLFATGGLEFWVRPLEDKSDDKLEGKSNDKKEEPVLSGVKRLGLATKVNLNGMDIDVGPAPLGGERRVMHWYDSDTPLPPVPDKLVDKIAESGCCRLILLTPACFANGWLPDWLLQTQDGLAPQLEAAVVGKPQTVSGWDFEQKGPKPTRRLVPAGSIYYLRLGTTDKTAITNWVNHIWLQNISDEEEDRLSGFGLTAVGVWDGVAHQMEVSHG